MSGSDYSEDENEGLNLIRERNRRTFDENRRTFDENRRTFDENRRTFDETQRIFVDSIRSGISSRIRRSLGFVVTDPENTYVLVPLNGPAENYDQNLTPAHTYLGDGMHESTGRTIFEEGVIHTIPVIFLRLNLMPGQILPIIACSPHIKFILKYALARNRVFGVSYKNKNTRTYGTIAEIYENSVEIETTESFQIKAMGHQRYEILRVHQFPEGISQQSNMIALADIKIIPDVTLKYPYNKLCLHPKKRTSNHSAMCRKKDLWQTQWPDWVYKQFDVDHLASKVAKKVRMLYKDVKISDDPFLLSLQVTKLGIFNQKQVSYLLGIASSNQRLQYILQYWEKNQSMQTFMCAHPTCGIPVCNMSKVFPMSPEGPQGTYCNSWGQIHDMITVTELDEDMDPITVGFPSTECCWFPGYKWVIIMCPNCQSHLGWRYLADLSKALIPRVFYGLSMKSITSTRNYLQPAQNINEINDDESLVTF